MPHVTYDNIEPNIAEVDVDGATVNVKWKCPVSGRVICESSTGMTPVANTPKKATNMAKKALLYEALGALNRFISHTFGGTAGKMAASASVALRQGGEQTIGKPTYNTASEHAAVVEAFRMVEKKFKWDEDRELYVAAS